ncbi:LysR family transcriptional regulator [Microvirga sp. BT291]|nr:LysR family transcriptional regulator [Microvirga pudoricolor]
MNRNIDIALLRAFVTVIDAGGMTAATGTLKLTQAAVSLQIKRLEDLFGETLITRGRRGFTLTREGERLLVWAQRMLALNDEMLLDMETPEFDGEIRLGIPSDIMTAYLPMFLKNFVRDYPRARVTFNSDSSVNLRRELDAGSVDLAITTELSCDPGGETLRLDPLVWVGAPKGDAARRRPLPVSIGWKDCTFVPPMREALRRADIPWYGIPDLRDTTEQVAAVAADVAVMVWMTSTVPSGFEILDETSGLPPLPPFMINLHLPRSRPGHLVRELARHIRGALAETREVAA